MRIQDRVAIVTGGGSGIGRATAVRLAEEGAKAAVFDIDLDGARATAREIESGGGSALALDVDVSDSSRVNAGVEEVLSRFGRIDILVNNAGLSLTATVKRTTEEEWDRILDVNLKSVFLCCKAVAPHMRAQRYGKIVNISSILGLTGSPGMVHYGAAKTGVIGFTRGLAAELGLHNINVNAVGPGIIETPMLDQESGAELRERLKGSVPLRRLGHPRDIANAVLFLASDEASYITGQCIFVCGGWSSSAGLG